MAWSHRAPRRPSPIRAASGPDAEQYADEMEQRAKRLAATFGLCATCGVYVGADGVHAWSCTAVPCVRRANLGRQP